jgi:hypothetical protein
MALAWNRNKINEAQDRLRFRICGPYALNVVVQRETAIKKQSVGMPHSVDIAAREPASLHAHNVEAAEPSVIADRHTIGNNVPSDRRHAANERIIANAAELMDRSAAADDDTIANLAVPANHHVVGKGHTIAKDAIMCHMRIGEKHAVVSNNSFAPAQIRAAIHGYSFADRAILADPQSGSPPLVCGILRVTSHNRMMMNFGALANCRDASDNRMAHHNRIVAKHNVGTDMDKRTNLAIGTYLCAFFNQGGVVNAQASPAAPVTTGSF